ncbi:MAG: hypothetical protein GXW85_09885 [Clostridia bacterium]|nr:hypothetical protein [Clostridia bacterium]
MMGRYGGDQLSMFLVTIAVVLALIARFAHLSFLAYLSYLPLGVAIFRILSKNTAKRSMENYRFVMLLDPLYRWYNKTRNQLRDLKTHRYFRCPNCRITLRVPRGRGKIIITCPRCKTRFTKET